MTKVRSPDSAVLDLLFAFAMAMFLPEAGHIDRRLPPFRRSVVLRVPGLGKSRAALQILQRALLPSNESNTCGGQLR